MSLNHLPPELTARVVPYLAHLETPNLQSPPLSNSKPHISQYACASINLQDTIERRLFSHLALKSDDLSTFEALVAHSSRRRASLQYLSFTPVLPAYDVHACARFERPNDHTANDGAFAAAVKRLYAILHTCDMVSGEKPLQLRLDTPFSPSDEGHQDWNQAYASSRGWDSASRQEVWMHRYEHSFLRLDEEIDLAASNESRPSWPQLVGRDTSLQLPYSISSKAIPRCNVCRLIYRTTRDDTQNSGFNYGHGQNPLVAFETFDVRP